jgi:GNAT superfamily N-acetyltransferase
VTDPTSPDHRPRAVASHREAAALAEANAAAARSMRHRIEQRDGGIAEFHRHVCFEPIDDPASRELDKFHAVLASGILPGQLVPISEFAAALGSKNADRAFRRAIGPYRYDCLAARTKTDGMIGAAGFVTFCHQRGPATLHASYYALRPAFRGLGLGRRLLDAVASVAVRFIAGARLEAFNAGPVVQFIETNSIGDMTLADRLLDEAIGMHPLARDAMWERVGFREIMDIRYRQRATPPIALSLKALLIDVERTGGDHVPRGVTAPRSLPGDLVLRHLRAFDNLLLNHDAASRVLARGEDLPEPGDAGLFARLPPGAVLPVKSLEDAARERRDWRTVDERLSRSAGAELGKTMRVLRDLVDGVSSAPPLTGPD